MLRESAHHYQDTIQKLKERVGQLQHKLALEDQRESSLPLGQDESAQINTDSVQNKIQSMKLNFELLEQKLDQDNQGNFNSGLPDSGRVFVVSGREAARSLNLLSQGSYTARGNNVGGDRSAGHESLETVADFQ